MTTVPSIRPITLDRTKPFSTVHPPENDAHFFQSGIYFNAAGEVVEALLTDESRKIIGKRKAEDAARAAADEAYRSAMEGEGDTNPPPLNVKIGEEAKPPAAPEDVDLKQWLLGQKSYGFFSIRKAVTDTYNRSFQNKDDIIKFLTEEEMLVPAEAVRV